MHQSTDASFTPWTWKSHLIPRVSFRKNSQPSIERVFNVVIIIIYQNPKDFEQRVWFDLPLSKSKYYPFSLRDIHIHKLDWNELYFISFYFFTNCASLYVPWMHVWSKKYKNSVSKRRNASVKNWLVIQTVFTLREIQLSQCYHYLRLFGCSFFILLDSKRCCRRIEWETECVWQCWARQDLVSVVVSQTFLSRNGNLSKHFWCVDRSRF